MRHRSPSGASCIWWMFVRSLEWGKASPPSGKGAKRWGIMMLPMQIGFLYYPEFHHLPRRAYTFLILQGCFFSSLLPFFYPLLSTILSRTSICVILAVWFIKTLWPEERLLLVLVKLGLCAWKYLNQCWKMVQVCLCTLFAWAISYWNVAFWYEKSGKQHFLLH